MWISPRSLRASVIPLITIPVSLIGTFALMALFGFSINSLTLLALVLAIGLVVDDSIVVLENIVRYVEEGMHPLKAALKGSKEVGFTIISISISLVAVFIPIFFMPGPIGLLFREFAVVVSLSILVSAVVPLTLVPMLCSRFLKPVDHAAKHGLFYRTTERILQASVGLFAGRGQHTHPQGTAHDGPQQRV